MRTSPVRSLQGLILALMILGLIGLALGGYLTPVIGTAVKPLVSAQTWLATRYAGIQNYLNAPQDIARLRTRNRDLEAENSQLRSQIIELQQQMAETRILSALVDFARVHPENRFVGATVIGRDPSPFVKYIIINRGSDHGLRRGMPVVTDQGLVGRVAAVTAGAARVQLISDPDSSINVSLQSAGITGMLNGSLTGQLTMDMIPQSAKVAVGDLVMTSGLGGNYPANLIIGQVTNVTGRETDLFQTADIEPIVNFDQLEIVLLIVNFRPVDIEPLVPTPGAP
jgi:rod shape-determining protein MreC